MAYAATSKQAQAYLIDPMNAPEPSQETGLNAAFTSTFAPRPEATPKRSPKHTPTSSLSSNNPFRTDSTRQSPVTSTHGRTHSRKISASKEAFPDYRSDAFGELDGPRSRSQSAHSNSQRSPTSDRSTGAQGHRRRTSSLQQRFPGDESNEPLKIIRRDSKKAYKSPHLRKHHIPGADTVDRLDPTIGGYAYHHEGPYDAALLARNSSFESSPLAALEASNAEALKATPQENIRDAVERHRPLEGTAQVPSGMPDRFGRVYTYEEGADLMHEGVSDAGYKRWPGVEYHKDDLKGKGEPAFSLDQAMKAHKINGDGIELEERQAYKDEDGNDSKQATATYSAVGGSPTSGPRRSNSIRAAGEGLKRRIGSLRHKKKE